MFSYLVTIEPLDLERKPNVEVTNAGILPFVSEEKCRAKQILDRRLYHEQIGQGYIGGCVKIRINLEKYTRSEVRTWLM
jgi:hypothetical protein